VSIVETLLWKFGASGSRHQGGLRMFARRMPYLVISGLRRRNFPAAPLFLLRHPILPIILFASAAIGRERFFWFTWEREWCWKVIGFCWDRASFDQRCNELYM